MQEALAFIRHTAHSVAHSPDTAFDAVHDAHDHVLAPLQGFGRQARNKGNCLVESFLDGGHDFAHGPLNAAPDVIEHCGDCTFNAVHDT